VTRWQRGADRIETFLAEGTLQQITGGAADGTPLLAEALETSQGIIDAAQQILPTLSFFR